ncbi:MAG: hypothetical protein GWO24_09015, partial [Akkermansiaceae bacterium]|nr:hypothetical protein [Akkermansiaceae bacterium]
LLDGSVYFTHDLPTIPLTEPDQSAEGSVTLTNEGNSTATITALNLSGPGAAAYSVSETFPISVGP